MASRAVPIDPNLIPLQEPRAMVKLGAYRGWEYTRKFGRNPDIDTGTEDVWMHGGVRTLPTSASVVAVVSDSAADDADGTGARTVKIEGLDADYKEINEMVTMDGTSEVNTTLEFLRVSRAYNLTAGSNEVNVGTISFSINDDVQATIEAGEGQTLQLMDTVPVGKTLFITEFNVVSGRMGTDDLTFRIQTKEYGGESAWRTRYSTDCYQTQVTAELMLQVSEKEEVRVQGTVTGSDVSIAGTYTGYLIDEVIR